MTTQKNRTNRQNALRSTGPRTAAGKLVSSRNALRHGAYSEAVLLLGEEPAAFDALHNDLVAFLAPAGPLEGRLVHRLASLWWRIERAGRAEREKLKNTVEEARFELGSMRLLFQNPLEEMIHKPAPDHTEPTCTAFTWQENGEKLERLLRYEGQLERSFFRTLHELERLQAKRSGLSIPPPIAIDLNMNGPDK